MKSTLIALRKHPKHVMKIHMCIICLQYPKFLAPVALKVVAVFGVWLWLIPSDPALSSNSFVSIVFAPLSDDIFRRIELKVTQTHQLPSLSKICQIIFLGQFGSFRVKPMILEYYKNCLEVESTFQKLNPLRSSHLSISLKVWYLPEKRFPEEEFFYSSEVAKLTRTNAKELSLKMKERQICRKKIECKSHLQIASWTWQGQRKGKESSRSETNESRSLFSSKEIYLQEEESFI